MILIKKKLSKCCQEQITPQKNEKRLFGECEIFDLWSIEKCPEEKGCLSVNMCCSALVHQSVQVQ